MVIWPLGVPALPGGNYITRLTEDVSSVGLGAAWVSLG